MPGTLYVVATPIGNLEDITLRALRILREVSLIAAEDTRRTARLLQHYSISTRTTSLHEHNERSRTRAIIAKLQGGESVALVSDAGTPGIADPGAHLVAEAHRAHIRVEPVPGPSAVGSALSVSGLGGGEFVFVGFPPARSSERIEWFTRLARESRPLILFEAPHRIRQTLNDALVYLGDRPIIIARELTKVHEHVSCDLISAHLQGLREPRGEYTLVVGPPPAPDDETNTLPSGRVLREEFSHMTKNVGLPRREALRQLATRYRTTTREIYRSVLGSNKSVE